MAQLAVLLVLAVQCGCLSSPTPLTPVFVPGEEGRTIYRIPSLLSVGDTLFAFAESRTGSQDGCYPLHPAKGDGRTAIHFKTSTDGGKSWSNMTDICPKAPNCTSSACKEWMKRSCLDFEAVYDKVTRTLVVQYCQGPGEAHCTNMQVISKDLGKSWQSTPTPLAPALGAADGVLVGPGRGLQLQSPKHHPGRLLFCGHKDPHPP